MTTNIRSNMSSIKSPIFITARFRSGSTMLWNMFRQLQETRVFYEPLHDQLVGYIKYQPQVPREHFSVKTYFDEYHDIPDVVSLHRIDFANHKLLLESDDLHPELHAYIQALVNSTPSGNQTVLQFNRIDFRLAWIKKNFPDAKLLHLFRDPRDQWYSTLTRFSGDIDHFVDFDHYYLATWPRDLYKQFPFLVSSQIEHPYQRFYYIWKLSYLAGQRLSDLSVAYEDILAEPEELLTKMLSFSNLYSDNNIEACQKIIISKPERTWTQDKSDDWFLEIEKKCEQVLDEFGLNKNFALLPLSEIQQSSPKYQTLLSDPENDAWAMKSFTQAVAQEQSAVYKALNDQEKVRKQLDEVRADLGQIETQLDEAWTDRDKIQTQLDEVWADREKIQTQLDEVWADREKIRKQLDKVWADRGQIQTQLDEVWADRDKVQTQLDEVWADRDKVQTHLDKVWADRDKVQTQLDEVWVDRDKVQTQLDEVWADRGQIQNLLDEVWADREKIQTQLDEAGADRDKIQTQLDVVQVELKGVYNSRSYRITAPLRYVFELIRRWRRK